MYVIVIKFYISHIVIEILLGHWACESKCIDFIDLFFLFGDLPQTPFHTACTRTFNTWSLGRGTSYLHFCKFLDSILHSLFSLEIVLFNSFKTNKGLKLFYFSLERLLKLIQFHVGIGNCIQDLVSITFIKKWFSFI